MFGWFKKKQRKSFDDSPIVKFSELPEYMETRLTRLHEAYSNIMGFLKDETALDHEDDVQTALKIVKQRIVGISRPELQFLLFDESATGVLKALMYLDDEVVKAMDDYKRTGRLADMKVWK